MSKQIIPNIKQLIKKNKINLLIINIIAKEINNLLQFNTSTTNSLPKIVLIGIKLLALNIIINKIIFFYYLFKQTGQINKMFRLCKFINITIK